MSEIERTGQKGKYIDLERLDKEKKRIFKIFEKSDLVEVNVPSLLNASELLDLYGEDLRLRAYTTSDPVLGEQVLRPDFTLPILMYFLESGRKEAKYFCCGNIWRRQKVSSIVPSEQLQVGFEFFDKTRNEKVIRDVEAYLLVKKILKKFKVKAVTGDLQILTSAINELNTSEYKKNALKRHIWRPERFKRLLEIFSNSRRDYQKRSIIKDFDKFSVEKAVNKSGPIFGIRTKRDIVERTELIKKELFENPIKNTDKSFIEKVQGVNSSLLDAPKILKSISEASKKFSLAIDNLEKRMDLLEAGKVNLKETEFMVTYGMTTLEYYDGFVFGFLGKNMRLPPIAQGGRYDRLCQSLAKNENGLGAIGSMIRLDFLQKI